MCNPGQHPDVELGASSAAPPPPGPAELAATAPLLKRPASTRAHGGPPSLAAPAAEDSGVGSALLDSLPPAQQMLLVSFLMFLFFGMHNILQEALVRLLAAAAGGEGTQAVGADTLMLSYAEVLGVTVFSYLERVYLTREGGLARVAPLRSYPLLTACLFASSCLSNLSLSYINFPTKVVFRSCKLVPTMIIATIVNQRVFRCYDYLCALAICAGLALFAVGDYNLESVSYSPVGLSLVVGSVFADAILPNAQERLFKAGSSRLEVTVYSNLFGLASLTALTLANGGLPRFLRALAGDATLATYFGAYAVLSYVSVACYMTLVRRFGGVAAVVLTTARKAMTLVLSFLLFPKGFSWMYVYASALVLGAVMIAAVCKKLEQKAANTPPRSPQQGEYSLQYRDDDTAGREGSVGDGESRMSASMRAEDSQLERSAEAILEDISKRAHV